jgi:hypothetical protein
MICEHSTPKEKKKIPKPLVVRLKPGKQVKKLDKRAKVILMDV